MICSKCKKEIVPSSSIAPGYATLSQDSGLSNPITHEGNTFYPGTTPIDPVIFCYSCAAEIERADMIKSGYATLCVGWQNNGKRPTSVGNWTGDFSIPISFYRMNPHYIPNNRPIPRYDVWFIGPDGKVWHGTNIGDNDLCRCERTKYKSLDAVR